LRKGKMMFGTKIDEEDLYNAFSEAIDEQLKKHFVQNFNIYIDQFKQQIFNGKEVLEEAAKRPIFQLVENTNKLEDLTQQIHELAAENKEQQQKINELIESVRKRDAIITRKQVKIEQLKAEIKRLKNGN